jgi:chromosome segregation ATPase
LEESLSAKVQASTVTLDERIIGAFRSGVTSADVAALISEAETAAAALAQAAEKARTRALDPTLSSTEITAARRAMEDAAFRRDRMQEAVPRLNDRLKQLRREEEQARRWKEYTTALAERDALATELDEVYPAMAERLAGLMARVASNDAAIDRVNRSLPDGAKWMASAEFVARSLSGWNDGTAPIPRITAQMRLPAFRYDRHDPYAWPRPR